MKSDFAVKSAHAMFKFWHNVCWLYVLGKTTILCLSFLIISLAIIKVHIHHTGIFMRCNDTINIYGEQTKAC